eukprot:SAG31_NODE_146_length_22601_cov_56.529192_26_plen_68_part_00
MMIACSGKLSIFLLNIVFFKKKKHGTGSANLSDLNIFYETAVSDYKFKKSSFDPTGPEVPGTRVPGL